jgi:hypothetical protein
LRQKRLAIGILLGLAVVAGGVLALTKFVASQELLHGGKEARRAAILALPKIDPETAAKAGITERRLIQLEMDKAARKAAVEAWESATEKSK